jgi:hypothetical protein
MVDAKSIATEVVTAVRQQQTAATAGTMPTAAIGPNDFCSIWPKAKPILEFVAGIALLIPGLGATAGAVLSGLVKVGDQVAHEICR